MSTEEKENFEERNANDLTDQAGSDNVKINTDKSLAVKPEKEITDNAGDDVVSDKPFGNISSEPEIVRKENSPDADDKEEVNPVQTMEDSIDSPAAQERLAVYEDESVTGTVDDEDTDDDEEDHEEEEHQDISSMSIKELLPLMISFSELEDSQLKKHKRRVSNLKDAFTTLIEEQKERSLKLFLDDGGDRKDYVITPDESEEIFYKAYKSFTRRRNSLRKNEEKQREENLKIKRELLDQMKDLIQNEENIQKAFNGFHQIQEKWRETGPVPGKAAKDTWMTYRHYVDSFYNLININRELRELDQKRNLEIKLKICEEAEDLLIESNVNRSLSTLRALQKRWRESGFIERSKSQEVWERFKSAVDKIYGLREAYRERMKSTFADNVKAKELLIEQSKVYAAFQGESHRDWQKKQEEIIELQNLWKNSGMVDKDQAEKLWNSFRLNCDTFFKNKNDYYKDRKKEFSDNLERKKELCVQAESLVESEDWKFATNEFKKLQAEWKKVGPVSEKFSNKIWHRFRKACDAFFSKKSKFYSSREEGQEENLKKKMLILEEAEKLQLGDDIKANLTQLKDFQRKWSECGLVPISKKNELQTRFRKAIDKHFDSLKLNDSQKRKIKFDQKIEAIKGTSDSSSKIQDQRKLISSKLRILKSEVAVWENNIGFFANTKNAQSLKDEFDSKIEKAKQEIEILKEQLDMIQKS